MVKITLFPESAIYENVKDATNSKDVSDFIDTLVEYGENIDVEQIKNELENCDDIEELDAVFKKYFNRSWISLEVSHLDYEVWVNRINKYGCHGPEVAQSWLVLETDDLEEAKAKARDSYEPNSDYIVELRKHISVNYDSYDLDDFKEYNDSIFNVHDFVDAEYNPNTNTCDLKFYDKDWNITAYIHNAPIPEWLKTEEDGKLVYIFDFSDWQDSRAIEYALNNGGVKEIVKEIERI